MGLRRHPCRQEGVVAEAMKVLIVSGGVLAPSFLKQHVRDYQPALIMAADRGLDVLKAAGIVPDMILGDYDSTDIGVEEYRAQGVPVLTYPSEKNFTDTEAALVEAIDRGATMIHLLGATGGRLDHFLGAIQDLMIPLEQDIRCVMIDELNQIELLRARKKIYLKKNECFGKYVSFIPFGGAVRRLNLIGFQYPLTNAELKMGSSLGISNEITEEIAEVSFSHGMLLMVMSKDCRN